MNRSHIEVNACARALTCFLLLGTGCFAADMGDRATSDLATSGEDDAGAGTDDAASAEGTDGPGATSESPGSAEDGASGSMPSDDDGDDGDDGNDGGDDDGDDDDNGDDDDDDGGSTGGPEPIEPVIPAGAIVAATFDDAAVGPYDPADWVADWNAPPWNNGLEERVEIIADGHTGQAMRVNHTEGLFGPDGGANWNTDLGGSYDTIYMGYWVRFGSGIDFRKGGTLGGLGGGLLPGDTPTPTLPNGTNGWSYKAQWRMGGVVNAQTYHMDTTEMWGDQANWTDGGLSIFDDGQWHHVQHKVVMNTPGQTDGSITGWFDGVEAFSITDLRFRDIGELGVDSLRFTNFFGGGDDSWSPVKNETVDFDDFVVSPEPILPGT